MPQGQTIEDLGPIQVEDLGPIEDQKKSDPAVPAKPSLLQQRLAAIKKGKEEDAVKRGEFYDVVKGGLKGLGSSVLGLDEMVIRGLKPVLGEPDARTKATLTRGRADTKPTNTAQKIGKFGEQAAEFVVPEAGAEHIVSSLPKMGRMASALTRGTTHAAGNYGLAKVQGDERPKTAAAFGAVGGASELLSPAAKAMRGFAERSMRRVLSAGSEVGDKATEKAINESVPFALDLGLAGTWRKILSRAEGAKGKAWKSIETALAGPEGDAALDSTPIRQALSELKSKAENIVPFSKTGDPLGAAFTGNNVDRRAVAFNQRLLKKINEVDKIIESHGPTIKARDLHNIKQDWNDFVNAAGGFSGKKLRLEARAKRVATDAMRAVFTSETPSIAAADRSYHLASQTYATIADAAGLGKMTPVQQAAKTEAAKRVRQFVSTAGGGAGAAVGAYAGHSPTASAIGALVGSSTAMMIERAIQSPGWKLLPSATAQALSEAIVSGNAERARQIVQPLLSKTAAGSAP